MSRLRNFQAYSYTIVRFHFPVIPLTLTNQRGIELMSIKAEGQINNKSPPSLELIMPVALNCALQDNKYIYGKMYLPQGLNLKVEI